MSSIQSRLFNLILRNRHYLRLSLKRETWDLNTSIPAFRQECEAGARRTRLPEGIQIKPARIDGLPSGLAAEWILPDAAADDLRDEPVIFYTHGGGYVSGTCSDH